MISYDNYKNRILKLAKAKRIVHKFRFLICGVLAVLIAGSVGLMVAKGVYMSDMSMPAQIAFNTYYEPTPAKAFLASQSSQRVEYSADGEEWATEKPVKAGKYRARTVSPKLVGYSYSNVVDFEITPLPATFTVKGDSVIYGNVPECDVSGLVSGHRVVTENLVFSYDDYAASQTNVKVVESSVKIIDASGDDFTGCYVVTSEGKNLTVAKRSLTLSPEAHTVTYDGKAHVFDEQPAESTLSELAHGDTVVMSAAYFYGNTQVESPVNAGAYSIAVQDFSIYHGDVDVTAQYNVTAVRERLTIERRALTVNAGSDGKIYDGTPLTCADFTAENLAEGHYAYVAQGFTLPAITDSGTARNLLSVDIFDADGNDVTANYAQSCAGGTLTVNKRPLTVTTASDEKTYDGAPLENFGFEKSEELLNFTFTADRSGERSAAAGVHENIFFVRAYLNGDEVTHNFDITYVNGTLEILKRGLTLTTGSAQKTYDGAPLSCDDPDLGGDSLPDGQYLALSKDFSVTNATAAGGVDNLAEYAVLDRSGAPVTENFDVTYVYGKLAVNPMAVTVTVGATEVYYGEKITPAHSLDCGYLPNGEALSFGVHYERNGAPVSVEEWQGYTLLNKGVYSIIPDEGTREISGGNARVENYAFTFESGTLTVNARPIIVKTASASKIYDGTALFKTDGCDTRFAENSNYLGLLNGDTISFDNSYIPSITNVGTQPNDGVYTADSDNYTVAGYDKGTLEITVRNVYVITNTSGHVYDGNDYSDTTYTDHLAVYNESTQKWEPDETQSGLLGGEKLEVNSFMTVTKVKTIDDNPTKNVVDYGVPNSNYRIAEYEYGELSITPRPITVELNQIANITYGDSFYYADAAGNFANTPDLANGETLKIAVKYTQNNATVTPKNAGVYAAEIDLKSCVVYDKNGAEINNGIGNYKVDCAPITNLQIGKGTLKIALLNFTRENGDYLTYGDSFAYPVEYGNYDGVEGLIDGESLKITQVKAYYYDDGGWSLANPRNADRYKLDWSAADGTNILVTGDDGEYDGYDNYNVSYACGYLDIIPRALTVTIDDKTATYGDSLPANGFEITDGEMQYGEELSLTYVYDREVKYVGSYEISQSEVFVDGVKVDPDNCNYAFTFENGTLTITARAINIKTADGDKTYDGTPLSKPTPTLTSKDESGASRKALAAGDEIEIVFTFSITDATETDEGNNPVANENTYKIVNQDGDDVTENYSVSYTYGELYISRKSARLYMYNDLHYQKITYGDSWAYPTGKGNYRSVSGLVDGEEIEIAVKIYLDGEEVDYPKNVGKYTVALDRENTLVYRKDGTINPVGLDNYHFDPLLYGKLEVEAKRITITIDDGAITYGQSAVGKTYNYAITDGLDINGKLPYSEDLQITQFIYTQLNSSTGLYEEVTPKDAGDYKIEGGTVLADGEEEGAKNYYITYAGALTVDKKHVYVSLDQDWEETYGALKDTPLDGWLVKGYSFDGGSSLEYGENLAISLKFTQNGAVVATPKNAGVYITSATAFMIIPEKGGNVADFDKGFETLKNYVVHCADGALTITPAPITVTIGDKTAVYGDNLPANGFEITDGEMQYGEELTLTYKYDRTVKNVGTYDVLQNEVLIDGVKVDPENCNYAFTFESGTLTITARPIKITVSPEKSSVKYGDEIPAKVTYTVTEGNIIDGDKIEITCGGYTDNADGASVITPKNKGSYKVVVGEILLNGVKIAENSDDENYKVTCVCGDLEIEARPITVVLSHIDNVTYGESFHYSDGVGNYANAPDLAYGEKLQVAVEYLRNNVKDDAVNAGTYNAQIDLNSCKIFASDGVTEISDGIENYEVTCQKITTLEIYKRGLTIQVSDMGQLVYGDEPVYPDRVGNYDEANTLGLQYGEKLKIETIFTSLTSTTARTAKNVGSYAIRLKNNKSFKVYTEDGKTLIEGGESNYEVSLVYYGTLEIIQRDITISLLDLKGVEYGDFNEITFYPGASDDDDTKNNIKNAATIDLAYGESIVVKVKFDEKNSYFIPYVVGEYSIFYDGFTVYNEDGSSVLHGERNYNVTGVENGVLEIVKRVMTVELKDQNLSYGEYPSLDYEKLYTITGRFNEDGEYPFGDQIRLDLGYEPEVNGVGTYQTYIKTAYANESEEYAAQNYDFQVVEGTGVVTVNPLDIAIELLDISTQYGDAPVYPEANNFVNINGVEFPDNQQISLAVKYLDKYGNEFAATGRMVRGEYTIALDKENCKVYTSDGKLIEGGMENYNFIVKKNGTLTVNARELTVRFSGDTPLIYGDPIPTAYEAFIVNGLTEAGTLPFGEELTFKDYEYQADGHTASVPNCGKYIILPGTPLIGGEEDTNGNYEIKVDEEVRGTLTISKKQVLISFIDKEIEYGDYYDYPKPEFGYYTLQGWNTDIEYEFGENGGMELGDRLEIYTTFYQNGKDTTYRELGDYDIRVAAVRIYQAEGNYEQNGLILGSATASTSNYSFTFDFATLTVNPKKVTLTISQPESISYGDSLPEIGYDFNVALAFGESITPTFSFDPEKVADAGDYNVTATSFTVKDKDGNVRENGDKNYDITVEDATLTVNPLTVNVTIDDKTYTYGDLKAGEKPQITWSQSPAALPNGETIAPSFTFDGESEVYDAGTYKISASWTVEGGKLSNYDIVVSDKSGTLTIDPMEITVTVQNSGFTYGDQMPEISYSADKTLAYGEELKLTFKFVKGGVEYATPVNAGVYAIKVASEAIEKGNARIENYDVKYADNSPELEIEKREITLALEYGKTTFSYGDDYLSELKKATVTNLASGEIIEIAFKFSAVENSDRPAAGLARAYSARLGGKEAAFIPVDKGEYLADLDWENFTVASEKAGFDGDISNYKLSENFEFEPFAFTITAKAIVVEIDDASVAYGDELPTPVYRPLVPLVGDEELVLAFTFGDGEQTVKNADKYEIHVDGENSYVKGGKITNYEISYADNSPTLEITKRSATVTLHSFGAAFGATVNYPTSPKSYAAVDNLADGEDIIVTVKYLKGETQVFAPFDAGDYTVTLAGFTVIDADGNTIAGGDNNYDLTPVNGTLTITSLTIKVKTGDAEKPYDGIALSTEDYSIIAGTLPDGYTLEIDYLHEVTEVTGEDGEENISTFKVMYGGKESFNYVIEDYEFGALKVTPAPVTIALNGGVEVTYGEEYEEKITDGAVSGAQNGESITLALTYTKADGTPLSSAPVNAGKYIAKLDWQNCTVSGGNAKLSNYKLNGVCEPVEFEIKAKEVEITLKNVTVPYGDTSYGAQITFNAVSGTVNGESITLALDYFTEDGALLTQAPKNADKYVAKLNWAKCTASSDIANYTPADGEVQANLEIARKEITITMSDLTVEYGAEINYPADGFTATEGGYGETFQVTAKYQRNGVDVTPAFAGEYDILCAGIKVFAADGTPIEGGESNYKVVNPRANYGTLTIEGVLIKVTRAGKEKVYDGSAIVISGVSEEEVSYYYTDADGNRMESLPAGYTFGLVSQFSTDGAGVQKIKNEAQYAVFESGAISGKFIIEYEGEAFLEITARPVTISTNSASREYNGAYLTAGYECVYTGDAEKTALASGDRFVATQEKIKDKGTASNKVTLKAFNKDGVEVTSNYSFTEGTVGTLEVTARAIELTFGTLQSVYGDKVDYENYTITKGSAVTGEKPVPEVKLTDEHGNAVSFTVVGDDYLLNVGVYAISADKDSVQVEGGDAENYEFTVVGGTLTVTERHVTVVTDSVTKPYDGVQITLGGYTTKLASDQSKAGLVGGDELIVNEEELAATGITEVGSIKNQFSFSLPSGNYILDGTTYGDLTVTKRKIRIETLGAEKVYDGSALSNEGYLAHLVNDDGTVEREAGLLAGDTLKVVTKFSVVNVTNSLGVENKVKFEVDGDAAKNYEIDSEYEYGRLKVTAAPLTVTLTLNGDGVYEYGDITGDTVIVTGTATGAVNGESITIAIAYRNGIKLAEPRAVGDYTAEVDASKSTVYNKYGSLISNGINNYSIGDVSVSFKITKRAVSLSLGAWADEIYNGEEHSYDTTKLTLAGGSSFAYEENFTQISVTYKTEAGASVDAPVNAGSYTVSLDLSGTKVGDAAISSNYEVSCGDITFKIKPKEITVTLEDMEKEYDGEYFDLTDAADGLKAEGLCGDDKIECALTCAVEKPVNQGEYQIYYDTANFALSVGDKGNYTLTTSGNLGCTLTITARKITVKVNDVRREKGLDELTIADITSAGVNGGDGFVKGDLANAGAEFARTPLSSDTYETYTVTVSFTNDEVMKNYEVTQNDAGVLTVSERYIQVTPTVSGEAEYNGEAVSADMFGIDHRHLKADGTAEDVYGFTDEDLENITYKFTFVNTANQNDVYEDGAYPVNAGTYEVSVEVEGASHYLIEYKPATLVINPKKLTVTVANDGGETQFTYDNKKPEIKATLVSVDGLVDGDMATYGFDLYKDGKPAARYNADTYTVGVTFDGMSNYQITLAGYEVTIERRVIVVAPYDPLNGAKRKFEGEALALGKDDYKIMNGSNGEELSLADGDGLAITTSTLEPEYSSGSVQIITAWAYDLDTKEDISANYDIYYTRSSSNPYTSGYSNSDFRVRLEYEITEIHYVQLVEGATYDYTGSAITHEFSGENAIQIAAGSEELYAGHQFKFKAGLGTTKPQVSVGPAVGVYTGWLSKSLTVVDQSGADVSAIYKLVCDNPDDYPIIIRVRTVEVTIGEDLTKEALADGSALTSAYDGMAALGNQYYELKADLAQGHSVDVLVFEVDGNYTLGVVIYSTNKAGVRVDVSANYEKTLNADVDGVEVKFLTVKEANALALPRLTVTFGGEITAEALANGRGALYNLSENGDWVLNESYYNITADFSGGEEAEVVVLKQGDGYMLGVVIYKYNKYKTARSDASANFNLADLPQIDGVAVEYVNLKSVSSGVKEIYFDFTAAFGDNGDGTYSLKAEGEQSSSNYAVEGLSSGDSVTVDAHKNDDGSFTFTVYLYVFKENALHVVTITDKSALYAISFTAPDGVVINAEKGDYNDKI